MYVLVESIQKIMITRLTVILLLEALLFLIKQHMIFYSSFKCLF